MALTNRPHRQATFISPLLFTLSISLCCLFRSGWAGILLSITRRERRYVRLMLSYDLSRSIFLTVLAFIVFGLQQRFNQQETLCRTVSQIFKTPLPCSLIKIQLLASNSLLGASGIFKLLRLNKDPIGNVSFVRPSPSPSREQILGEYSTRSN